MSASAQGAPCPRCHAMGYVIKNIWDRMVICPECNGSKYLGSGPSRALAGICHNCKQEVNITGEPPCLPGYSGHIILSDFPSNEVSR